MADMDWLAAMDSGVFRIFAANELTRMKAEAQVAPQREEEEQAQLLEQFDEFERDVRSSPKKLAVFRALKAKFAADPAYMASVKESFVAAVMMLNLD